jgi:hypothetical protein
MKTDLVTIACEISMRAAINYLQVHDLTADDKALSECLRDWCKIKLPQAMADAKEAIECGMTKAAEATFAATMRLAGIEAAKEASRTKQEADWAAR